MITVKIYDTDSHVKDFEATVIACTEQTRKGKQGFAVELDRTAFFAEGGGQTADHGTITGEDGRTHKVWDVQEKEEHIFHYMDEALPVGSTIRGSIDWEFRFDNMQQHSGEHLLSGICYSWKGYHNVGFHLGEDVTTIDFDGPLTAEELRLLEERGNRAVWQNVPITVTYPSPEELAKMDYRSKKELTGDVRIVKVGDYDLCACCAPHVMLTGEIGLIKIVRSENYKGGVRITILCGLRALRDYDYKNDMIHDIAAGMSTKPEKIKTLLDKQSAETARLKEQVKALSTNIASYRLAELAEKARAGAGAVSWVEDLLDPVAARELLNQLVPMISRYAAVFIRKGGSDVYTLLIAGAGEDARKVFEPLKAGAGARGGGSKEMVQGSVEGSIEAILSLLP